MTKSGDVPISDGPTSQPILWASLGKERSGSSVVDSVGMTYRPLRDLGEGGTAKAVLAHAVGAGGFSKLVVLKILHARLADDPVAREMFEREARLSARLNHPNLVQVYEVVDADVPFLVMEYLDGKPLSRVLATGAMSQPMLLTILAEALIGLHHAHELCDFDGQPLNIVHRDISPHNVFATYDGAVKVLDFGIAKVAGGSSNTETGEVKGKLAYMAPEQLLGQRIDRRSDIFAAGCILWEAAVGSRIWGEMSDGAVMHRLATGEIPRPDGHTGMTPRLEKIVAKATATSPEDRYQTALELQSELTEYIEEQWGPCPVREIGANLGEIFKDDRERNKKILGAALAESSAAVAEERSRSKSGARPAVPVPVPVQPPPRSRGWAVAMVAGLILLAGVGVWARRSIEPAAATKPPPEAPSSVHILVRTTPAEASIEIDGKDRGQSPVLLEVTPDAQDHSVRAVAAGYLPKEAALKFSRDQEIEISLEKLAPPRTSAAPSSAAALAPQSHLQQAPRVIVAAPKPKPSASAAEPNCSPPYYFANGIKLFKPECL